MATVCQGLRIYISACLPSSYDSGVKVPEWLRQRLSHYYSGKQASSVLEAQQGWQERIRVQRVYNFGVYGSRSRAGHQESINFSTCFPRPTHSGL